MTHIINTHTHGDHTGSNEFFPASVEIVTQDNTKANMEKMPAFQDAGQQAGPARSHVQGQADAASAATNRSTSTTSAPRTPTATRSSCSATRASCTRATCSPTRGSPSSTANNGGSGIAYGETIGKAAAGIKNVDTVIPGHSAVMNWQDFVDFGEFNRLFLDHARASLKAGKTPEQAMASLKLPEKFKDYNLQGGRGGPGGNFNVIFEELKKQP